MPQQEMYHTISLYQNFTPTTAVYPGSGTGNQLEILYLSLGLMGEVLEWYDSGYDEKEAGDIFWYCSQVCNLYGWQLSDLFASINHYESCEVNLAEALKKYLRDDKNPMPVIYDYMRGAISGIKRQYAYSVNNPPLEDTIVKILTMNRDKLIDRQNRDVIRGDGNER
jgi:hypothetical protein